MASLKVRVRTPVRQVLVELAAGTTFGALKAQVAAALGVARVALCARPDFSQALAAPDAAPLAALGVAHGAQLYCREDSQLAAQPPAAAAPGPSSSSSSSASASASAKSPTPRAGAGPASSSSSSSSSSSAAAAAAPATSAAAAGASPSKRRLTARCQHGEKGACHHCDPATDAEMEAHRAAALLNKAGGRHAERSAAALAAGGQSGDLEWLCQHRPDAMCTNCAPMKKGEAVHLEMLCQHAPEARCINCLPPDSTVDDRKFISYDEWIARRRVKCEHAFSAVCVNCMPPSQVVYSLKPNCARHRPWPAGLCSDCQPPTVEAKLQPYRHVDFIEFLNVAEAQALVSLWDGNSAAGVQRAAFLYGSVADDANYRLGQRVIVEAMYEPPQRFDVASGAIAVLPDKRAKDVEAVAAACGLRRVGWFITQRPRVRATDPAVSPRELGAMARLQLAHPRPGKAGSQFVTVTVRKDTAGEIAPKGLMASDTVTAMVRDGVVADPLPSDSLVKIRLPRPGSADPPAPEVIVTSQNGQMRKKGTEFDPDLGVVTLEVGMGGGAGARACRFKHATFPVENREAFGVAQSAGALRTHLQRYKAEPVAARLSDFHLLLYLAQVFDLETAVLTARTVVAEGKEPPEGVMLMLNEIASATR